MTSSNKLTTRNSPNVKDLVLLFFFVTTGKNKIATHAMYIGKEAVVTVSIDSIDGSKNSIINNKQPLETDVWGVIDNIVAILLYLFQVDDD